jgi:hypothetical protein
VPHLLELAQKHAAAGLVVIGVHTTNGAEKMAAFVDEQKITYPVCADVDNTTTTAFAVDSYPDYYLIDRAGKLRVADLQNAALDGAIATLLAEPAPASDAKTKAPADVAAGERDAQKRLGLALAAAKTSGRKVLVHVHGPH